MATLAQGGFKQMSDAGTSLKSMLLSLQAPSDTAAGAIKDINLQVYDAAGKMRPLGAVLDDLRQKLSGMSEEQRNRSLKDIFGTDGIRAATIFMGDYSKSLDENSQRIRENIEAMGLQGEAARVAQERNESFSGQVRILKATWEQLVITVGEQLLPVLTELVRGITSALEVFKTLGDRSEELRGYLIPLAGVFLVLKANVVAAAGATAWAGLTASLTSLGGAVTALGTSVTAFVASNPLGALLVIASGVAMYANKINADIQSIYDSIERSEQVSFDNLMQKVQELNAAGDALSKAKAKYLLAFDQLQKAQQGTAQYNWMGQLTGYKTDPKAIELAEKRFAAARAELEAARAARPVAPLTGQGPLLPGQGREGPTSDYGLKVAAQTLKATGDKQADQLVDFCSRWVRLTLGRAQPEIAGYINRIFSDSNGDGVVLAQDAAANARKAGLLRQYKGTQDLKPGDTVFYTDGGQNHVGIYIGNGMVRGNNRVSYKASGGKNPVGDVGINSLGRVSGVLQADDLLAAARGGRPLSAASSDAAATASAKLEKAIAEGHRLIRQYELALKSGSDVWITKAHNAIEVFKKGNKEAWGPPLQQALSDVEKAFKKTGTSAAQAAAVSEAQYKKLAPRARELAALEARAKGKGPQAAEAARQIAQWVKTNGDAAKQVLDYERAALREGAAAAQKAARERTEAEKKAAQEREAIARQAEQGKIEAAKNSLERLKIQQARQLAAVEGNAAAEAKVRLNNANQLAEAQKKIAEAQYRAAKAAALKLPQANQKQALANAYNAYRNSLGEIENERVQTIRGANKTIADEQARLNRQLLEGRVDDARLTVERITSIHEQELVNFKGTLTQRKALVTRQANDEAAARKAVALAQKKLDEDAANRLTGQARKDALRRAQTTYDNAARSIETDRKKAIQDAGRALLESQRKQQEERNRIIQAGRQQDLELAEGAYRRLQQLREQDLRAAGDSAGKRLAVEQRYAADERKALETIAKLKYDIAVKKANSGEAQLRQGALALAKQQYDAAMTEAKNLNRVADAQKTLGGSVRDLRGEYSRLASGMREKIAAGKVEDADLVQYLSNLDELTQKTQAAGLSNNKMIQGAAANAAALYQQAIDVQIASGAYDGLTDSFNRASGAQSKQVLTLQDLLVTLPRSADEVEGFTAGIKLMAEQGLITNDLAERALLLIPDFGASLGQLGEGFAEVEAHLEGQGKRLDELKDNYDKGLIGTEAYGQGLEELAASYEMQAQAADRLGKTDIATFFRGAAQAALDLAAGVGHVSASVRELQDILDQLESQRLLAEGIAGMFQGNAGDVAGRVVETFKSGAFGELDDASRQDFLERLNEWLPGNDLRTLGREKLGELLAGLGDVDGAEAGNLREAIQGALGGLNTEAIGRDLGSIIERAGVLKDSLDGVADPVKLMQARSEWEALVAEAQQLQGVAQGTDLADWAGGAVQGIQAELDGLNTLLDQVMEGLSADADRGSAALEEMLTGITGELEKARVGLDSGTISLTDYNETVSTQREALDRLYDRLVGLGPAYAEAARSVDLLRQSTGSMTVDADKLADALRNADLAASRKAANDRVLARQTGTLSAQDFGTQTGQELVRLAQVARNLSEIGKTEAAGAAPQPGRTAPAGRAGRGASGLRVPVAAAPAGPAAPSHLSDHGHHAGRDRAGQRNAAE